MNKFGVYLIAGLFLVMMISAVSAEQERVQAQSEKQEGDSTGIGEQVTERARITLNNQSINNNLNITKEISQNRTMLKVQLSNGRNAEIKIMPETASETALSRLRLKVCNESNNCTIQLKEVGTGNETRPTYEMQIERHARILGIFRAKVQNKIQVDAETGDVLDIKKPWWTFIAAEED